MMVLRFVRWLISPAEAVVVVWEGHDGDDLPNGFWMHRVDCQLCAAEKQGNA